jgi:hypothetical protein
MTTLGDRHVSETPEPAGGEQPSRLQIDPGEAEASGDASAIARPGTGRGNPIEGGKRRWNGWLDAAGGDGSGSSRNPINPRGGPQRSRGPEPWPEPWRDPQQAEVPGAIRVVARPRWDASSASTLRAIRRGRLRWLRGRQARPENESHAVVAPALSRGTRTILEHMPLVAAATTAVVLGAGRDQAKIQFGGDGAVQRLPKAGPTRAALVFGRGTEQGQGATGTDVGAGALFRHQRAAERSLRGLAAQHVVGGGAEATAPFGIGKQPSRVALAGGCLRWPGEEQLQPCQRRTQRQRQNPQQLASTQAHDRSAQPAGAQHHGQPQEHAEQGPGDAIERVFGAAGASEHRAPAGDQTAHTIPLRAVQ